MERAKKIQIYGKGKVGNNLKRLANCNTGYSLYNAQKFTTYLQAKQTSLSVINYVI